MDTSNRAADTLDPDFATNGIFTFSTEVYGPLGINRLFLTADEKILVALTRAERFNVENFYRIGRLLKDGTPDPEFGINGVIEGSFPDNAASFGSSVVTRSDKKILLSGYLLPASGENVPRRPALVQYLDNGEIDREFGQDGFVYLDFPAPKSSTAAQNAPNIGPPDTGYEYFSFKTTPLADDKILFTGVTEAVKYSDETRYSVLGRLNADGTLDESFGDGGWVYPKPPRNIVDQHLIQPDGKILLAGQKEDVPDHLGYVARYLPDGALDPGFGTGGYAFIEGLDGGHVTSIAFYGAENKLLVGANKRLDGKWSGFLTSFTQDGQKDLAFNGGELVDIRLGTSGFKLILKDLVIDDDGVILLGDMGNIALTRYLFDGTPDLTYADGKGWIEFFGNESYDLARQPDGKILVTGMATSGEKFIARFTNN
jgi:uncharacterized delta-60 repeat protein